MKALIKNNADVNLMNKDKLSPFHLAVINKNFEAVSILLESKELNLNTLTDKEESIFHYLVPLIENKHFFSTYFDTLKKVTKPADLLNKANMKGFNPVHKLINKFVSVNWLDTYFKKLKSELIKKK